jgi:hypothetical protein
LGSFTWRELYQLYQQSSPGGATLRGVVQQGPVKQLEQSDVMVIKVLLARVRNSNEGDAEKAQGDDDREGDKGCNAEKGVAMTAAGVHLPGCRYKGITYDDAGKLQTSTLLLDYFAPPQYVQHQELTFAQAEGPWLRLAACTPATGK